LSTGFASAEDDARGAKHRNKSIATLSPYRTMRDGAVTAFSTGNSVHSDPLAHVIARANAIRKFFSMARAAARSRQPAIQNSAQVSLQSEFSNVGLRTARCFHDSCGTDAIELKNTAVTLCGI
jgi:hypothetical protein